MSALFQRYRFFLTHDGSTVEVHPDQDDAVDDFALEADQIFHRRRTDNDLKLVGVDFDWLLAREQSISRCMPVVVEFKRIVPGTTDADDFTGYAYLDDADFDLDNCTIRLKVESEDKYSRLTNFWEREVNFLQGTTKVILFTQFLDAGLTEIQQLDTDESTGFGVPIFYPQFDNPDFPDFHDGWVMITDELNLDGGSMVATRSARFMREVTLATYTIADPPPPGGAWRIVDAVGPNFKYARSIASVLQKSKTVSNPILFGMLPLVWTVDAYRKYYSWIPTDVRNGFTNGVLLEHVFTKLLSGSGITVKSNIFDINPAGASPDNSIYNTLEHPRLVLYQRSDVKRPLDSNPATVGIITLKRILANIRTQFQVYPVMDGDTMVLEHVSFFDEQDGLDFTSGAFAKALLGKTAYSYNQKDSPEGEDWIHEGDGVCQALFNRWSIYYDTGEFTNNCIARLSPRKQILTDGVCNDFGSLVANPEDFSDDGLTFADSFNFEGDRYLDAAEYFTQAYLGAFNASLGPPGLRAYWGHRRHFEFYKWYFPLPGGLGDALNIAASLIPFRKQVELSIPLNDLSGFDAEKRQKSQLGWGVVFSAKYSRKTGVLKITLLHQ